MNTLVIEFFTLWLAEEVAEMTEALEQSEDVGFQLHDPVASEAEDCLFVAFLLASAAKARRNSHHSATRATYLVQAVRDLSLTVSGAEIKEIIRNKVERLEAKGKAETNLAFLGRTILTLKFGEVPR